MKHKIEYKWIALSVTAIGMFMSSFDSTIVVIGLPTILQDLHATIVHGIWIITGYGLMVVVLLVLLGRLADMYGRVRLYNLGFAIFTLGSLACGLSRNGDQLVLFRFLQGGGAAMLFANSVAIITDAFPSGQLGLGVGTAFMFGTLGSIGGYSLGGVMINLLGWRSIFFINVPVGIFGTLWGYWLLKEISVRSVGEKFDYAGSFLYCAALISVLIALTIGSPLSPRNLAILAGGIVAFIGLIVIERKQKHPMLDLKLFRLRMFSAGNLASFLNSIAFSCGPFLRSLYLQLVVGYSPLEAGMMLIPLNLVVFVGTPIFGRLSDRYGSRVLASTGLALNAGALFWFSTLNEKSTFSAIITSFTLLGLGTALFSSPNSMSIMGCVPPERRGVANGVRMTLAQTGSVLSVPLSLALMTLVMPYDRLSQIVSSSQLLSSNELPAFLHAINRACLILGVIILLAIIPSLLRDPPKTATKVTKD